ncbi:huntingtin-interacting protein K isoform X1 [Falco biarmicus]|uniref:huntingtin-interacting protein K isoform X1 n=1 Tax=Falco biarmicus TaxID=345155 RepID=UPI0024BCBA63|nr:huntingtin-interacting protein K isoform X1 [Falco biarmicus]
MGTPCPRHGVAGDRQGQTLLSSACAPRRAAGRALASPSSRGCAAGGACEARCRGTPGARPRPGRPYSQGHRGGTGPAPSFRGRSQIGLLNPLTRLSSAGGQPGGGGQGCALPGPAPGPGPRPGQRPPRHRCTQPVGPGLPPRERRRRSPGVGGAPRREDDGGAGHRHRAGATALARRCRPLAGSGGGARDRKRGAVAAASGSGSGERRRDGGGGRRGAGAGDGAQRLRWRRRWGGRARGREAAEARQRRGRPGARHGLRGGEGDPELQPGDGHVGDRRPKVPGAEGEAGEGEGTGQSDHQEGGPGADCE